MKQFYYASILLPVLWFLMPLHLIAQSNFYDPFTIQKIEIQFSQSNWDYMLDTSKHGAGDYIVADWVKINDEIITSPGVKYKGNSSFDSTYIKNPLHINLDYSTPQSYAGFTNIKLSNGYADPSCIREVLAYYILKDYMDCPRSNFARVYINGNYIGLYSNDESINDDFCSRRFNSSNGTFLKCNPIGIPGPTTKSNLKYLGSDSTLYYNFYELQSNKGWNDLVNLCDTVTNYPQELESIFDVDRLLWMLAFNTVLVNLDSYTGVFCQNYYIYRDKTNRYNPVVWDLNMAFGGFPFVGSGATSMAALTIPQLKNLSPTFHESDPYWPLIKAVMNDPRWRKQFIAHCRTINNEYFFTGLYQSIALQLQVTVDSAVQADTNSFFTYSQFQNSMFTDYSIGSYQVPGIANLMDDRAMYLNTLAEFQAAAPNIISVSTTNVTPMMNETVTINAFVLNADTVILAYRNGMYGKFEKIAMYDDGLHNDGPSGDFTYGAEITITDFFTPYYVYAENSGAGVFNPERAEHEFYLMETQSSIPLPGQVVINEFLAVNLSGELNENGVRADWIELYNNTDNDLPLYGAYLTDDYERRAKWPFPAGTIIPAKGYLTLWADEEPSTIDYLHCSFRLSAAGEQLMLSNGFNVVLDSVSYKTQYDDVSFGRCPNGFGGFQLLGQPSFNSENCIEDTTISGPDGWWNVYLYPNPARDVVFININDTPEIDLILITDIAGREVRRINPAGGKSVNLYGLSEGVYSIEIFNDATGNSKRMMLVKAQNR